MPELKEFEELALNGNNYPTWASDIKIGFASRGILSTIEEPVANGPPIPPKVTYSALILLRTSIHKDLKKEYLLEENPRTLWVSLKERYEQQKEIIFPDAQYQWNHLRFQDFKSVADYDHAVHDISTRLKFCEKEPTDAEKIEKTLSTMHPSDRVICAQTRKEKHQTYSALMHSLTQAEKNDELLQKNHQMRPTGSAPLPEVHNNEMHRGKNKRKFKGPPKGNQSQGNAQNSSGGRNRGRNFIKNQRHKANKRARGKNPPPRGKERFCYKCGCNTHFASTCRTPKHLVDLYLKYSQENKQKGPRFEAHFNQANANTDQAGCSHQVPNEPPNNKALIQQGDLPGTDNMFVEYQSSDMFGDLS